MQELGIDRRAETGRELTCFMMGKDDLEPGHRSDGADRMTIRPKKIAVSGKDEHKVVGGGLGLINRDDRADSTRENGASRRDARKTPSSTDYPSSRIRNQDVGFKCGRLRLA